MEHALTGGPDYSIYGLVMGADPVVKGVMLLLVFASVATWAIIFEKMIRLRGLHRAIRELEDEVGSTRPAFQAAAGPRGAECSSE